MKRVMMAAPFATNGRYRGGITSIANAVEQRADLLNALGWELVRFETCRIPRNQKQGSFNLENIKNFLKIYKDLAPEIKQNAPECLYYHSSVGIALFKDLLAIRRAKRKTKLPIVLHIHFADYDKIMTGHRPLDILMLRWMKKYVDRVVFLSKKTMDEFIAHGLSDERCCVIYNFTTLEYSQEQMCAWLQSPSDKTRFLFVGSIDERKGIFDILECLVEVEGDFVFDVCGGFGSPKDEMLFQEYQKKLGKKMVFHGYVDGEEKKRIFLDADVLVLTSYGEGLPVVILEAFSAGCAILTSNVGAIPEIVSEDNGIIVHPGKAEEIKGAISQYMADERVLLREQQLRNYKTSKEYSIGFFIEKVLEECSAVSNKLR